MFIGESFVGDGVNAAHINVVLGRRDGPVGTAWATALATRARRPKRRRRTDASSRSSSRSVFAIVRNFPLPPVQGFLLYAKNAALPTVGP